MVAMKISAAQTLKSFFVWQSKKGQKKLCAQITDCGGINIFFKPLEHNCYL